ncbi:hypothetical protein ACJRO7_005715 [Eucalyptus globulus]|uniref:Uncharacterized protein n=1 Tax=Eucalyptus globulus TaxID=34317 RepID=A0ABD3J0L6_EUCGL
MSTGDGGAMSEECGGGLEETKLRWFWEEDGQSTIIKKILKAYRNRHRPRGRNRRSRCRRSYQNRKTTTTKKLSMATEGRGRDKANYGGGRGFSERKEKGLLRCEGKAS